MKTMQITRQEEFEEARAIRKTVFVDEQGVPLQDEFDAFDTLDGQCRHLLAYYEVQPVGTGRIRVVEGVGKLERICILAPYRKFGIGRGIIAALEDIAVEQGLKQVKLHGQTHAEGFYAKLGYRTASEAFMEDGIPHYLMLKDLADAR
ncbi:GNAT family N-acetyltransferase [Paenibacillus methanolicus]|uniref:Putative GNAT family N-acyltransferase n=1 Tax=Paenibacillus methanolicus TaxID=582686 RepID=A0A5S5C829_9BACL|nr:GNAT family N-acetyltransferase [Paenibacillus methanolicus]TYP74490.1 putative GNAT family N-acyltransferase [Paenibacillus methanolicus]